MMPCADMTGLPMGVGRETGWDRPLGLEELNGRGQTLKRGALMMAKEEDNWRVHNAKGDQPSQERYKCC